MDDSILEKLKSRVKYIQGRFAFAVQEKSEGKKIFETYLVKDKQLHKEQYYLRVTHPLSYWIPPAFKAWLQGNTQKAAEKKMVDAGVMGSKIHEWIELEFKKNPTDNQIDRWININCPHTEEAEKAIRNGINAFKEFWSGCGLEIIAQELKVFSNAYGFAGTIDMVGIKDGEVYIIDWKSGMYKATYGWQLAAYGLAFKELFGVEPKLLAVMLDKRTGKASKIQYEHPSHLESCYLGVLQAFAGENWKTLKEFWPWSLKEFHQIKKPELPEQLTINF